MDQVRKIIIDIDRSHVERERERAGEQGQKDTMRYVHAMYMEIHETHESS